MGNRIAPIKSWLSSLKNLFFWLSHRLLLPLRYKVEVKGLDLIDPKKGGVNSSILFLSNHSSHMDGTILSVELLKYLPLSVWTLDLTFKFPYTRWAAKHKDTIKLVKVPSISERRSEKHSSNLHKLITRTGDGLQKGKNFLIFPSGCCKRSPIEKIDGKSAVPLIIQQCPDINIILIRLTGLWGSRFSRATKPESQWMPRSVRTSDIIWHALKMIVFNGIFFIPKRKVVIELASAGNNFPRFGRRLEINRFLEKYFNEAWGPKGEPLNRVPDYFWKAKYTEHEYVTEHYHFNLGLVSKPFRNTIVKLIADKADLDCKEIDFDMHLGRDLGFDSLDLAEILSIIERDYAIKPMVPEEVTTVGHFIAIAAKIPISCEVKKRDFFNIEEKRPLSFIRFFKRIPTFFKNVF